MTSAQQTSALQLSRLCPAHDTHPIRDRNIAIWPPAARRDRDGHRAGRRDRHASDHRSPQLLFTRYSSTGPVTIMCSPKPAVGHPSPAASAGRPDDSLPMLRPPLRRLAGAEASYDGGRFGGGVVRRGLARKRLGGESVFGVNKVSSWVVTVRALSGQAPRRRRRRPRRRAAGAPPSWAGRRGGPRTRGPSPKSSGLGES